MTQEPGASGPMSERMQSLLSRAVEDQLSEQRQLAGALAEVRAQLGQLGDQLQQLEDGGAAGPQLEQALGVVAGEVREAVRLLGERIDGVARLVQERGRDLAEQRAMLGQLGTAVDGHAQALAGLGERLRGLEELTAAVGGLQQRSEAADASLRELRQAFAGIASRVAQLPGREDLEGISSRITEAALTQALGESGPPPATFAAADLAAVLNEIQALRDQVGQLPVAEPGRDNLNGRLEELREAILGEDGVMARLDGLEVDDAPTSGEALDADTVEELVANAVAASERRLAAHVDEAVLALAEALLRRRTPRAQATPTPAAPTPAAPTPTPAPAPARPTSGVAGVIDEDDADSDFDDDDEDDEIPAFHDRPDATPSDVPRVAPPAEAPAAPSAGEAADETAKRKPWWRPGG